jgi:hypothetical protein
LLSRRMLVRSLSVSFFLFAFVSLSAVRLKAQSQDSKTAKQPAASAAVPDCVPSAPDGYVGKACAVTIDRDNPASPTTLIVHGKTSVAIRVKNARWNENVTFTTSTSKVTDNDIVGTFLFNAIAPLQTLVAKTVMKTSHGGNQALAIAAVDPIGKAQAKVMADLSSVSTTLSNAVVGLNCLETYSTLDTSKPDYFCDSSKRLDSDSFSAAKSKAVTDMVAAASATLPLADIHSIDNQITARQTDADNGKITDLGTLNNNLSIQALIKSLVTDIQKAQTSMQETAGQLRDFAGAPKEATYTITQPRNYNSTVTVAAQEIVSKTPTSLATVTINWQSNPWEVSTGILFSGLASRSFTNAGLFSNGNPVLDSGGKNLTVVTQTDTLPAVVFPMVLGSFRIGAWSHANWENKCPNHCAILISGGVGANLTAKTTDFAVGPSFQIGEALFTPAAHFGRQTQLTDGVVVGAQLGSSPPTLPTKTAWVPAFGFAITYILPFH